MEHSTRREGGGEGSKWNYALLVPMLLLAAFRSIWTKESQREIREAKVKYDEDLKAVTKDLERKYRESLAESRRTAAHVELELEKERQRVRGYRQALQSQSQQLLEERKQLQREHEALEEEKGSSRGTAPPARSSVALERENEWQSKAMAVLREFETGLVERQRVFCSVLLPRDRRLELEKNLLVRAAKEPLAAELNMEPGLKDIFKNDRHCADVLNTDERKNGSLMWLYLRYWELQVTLQKHKRALESLQPKLK